VAIYSNPHALPRAFVVYRVSSASSPERALQRLVAPDFDPLLEAVVEGGPSLSPAPGRAGADGRAAILSYADGRVAVRVQTRKTGLLVLTDAYDPDWHATLNGDRVDIHPTDGLFRGVAVPPGDSEVVFHYDPVWFRRGAVISALTAVLSLALWVSALRRRERPG
jgi:hypothetical protein